MCVCEGVGGNAVQYACNSDSVVLWWQLRGHPRETAGCWLRPLPPPCPLAFMFCKLGVVDCGAVQNRAGWLAP